MRASLASLLAACLAAAPALAGAPGHSHAFVGAKASLLVIRFPLLASPSFTGGGTNFSGSGAVFDPIVPTDGTQNITGNLRIDGGGLLILDQFRHLSVGDIAIENSVGTTVAALKNDGSFQTNADFIGDDWKALTGAANLRMLDSAGNLLGTVFDDGATGHVSFNYLQSSVATGTAPLVVASTTVVTNLNADLLDAKSEAAFASIADSETITGTYAFQPAAGAPFTTNSTTVVTNLNADTLDGVSSAGFVTSGTFTNYENLLAGSASQTAQGTAISAFAGNLTAAGTACLQVTWTVPASYASGNPTILWDYSARTGAASAAVVMETRVYEATRVGDDPSLPAATYSGGNVTTTANCATTGDYCAVTSITPTGLSIAAGDLFIFETCRKGDDAADTWTGVLAVFTARLSYTANKGF